MRKNMPAVFFSISVIILTCMAGFIAWRKTKTDPYISCLAVQSTAHGDNLMQGKFDFLFQNGKGRIRINGKMTVTAKDSIISRQIFFTYTRHDSDYVLKSYQVQMMNNGDSTIVNRDFNHHFPAFFSQEDKQLAMAIRQDRSGNHVMYFAEVPVFFCQPKK
ncbi:hypothetical protein ACKU08_000640 [Enterobacter cloacae]|uniref:hypothetical protein n=1 Tax=Enterobacter cloacae TaxID=550 RepID=UPI001A31DD34|nr:hypothetical protein [Enterobacter cloacae]